MQTKYRAGSVSQWAGLKWRLLSKQRSFVGAVLCFSWGLQTVVQAASPLSADDQWQSLKNFGRPLAQATGKAIPAAKRTANAATLIDQANQLKAFYTAHPTHAAASEARRLETLALIHAGLNGDTAQDARRAELLGVVRKDTGLPSDKRFEAVAWSQQLAITQDKPASRSKFLAAQESATRSLIAEFSDVPTGYESLLVIARESEPSRGSLIARDILAMASAPSPIKTESQRVLARFGLLGQPLDRLLTKAGASPRAPAEQGKVVVLYTWTKDLPKTLTGLAKLADKAPQAAFIGVCLDSNVDAAKTAADRAKLPGKQYFDAKEFGNRLGDALHTGRDLIVYIIDRSGIIRDVQGRDDMAKKIAEIDR